MIYSNLTKIAIKCYIILEEMCVFSSMGEMYMELTIALALSILSSVIAVSNFVLSRKDKAVKDTKENNYELIKYQVEEIKEDVKSILSKLDRYEREMDEKIDKAIELHIKVYHKDKGE